VTERRRRTTETVAIVPHDHGDLQRFLSEPNGKVMLRSHGLRRAFFTTAQRVNETLPGYTIDIHKAGLSGLARPIGSLRVTDGELMVMHHLPNGIQTTELNTLADALARKFRWKVRTLPNLAD